MSGQHAGPAHEGNSRTMGMHAGEESDGCIVPVKPRTKPSDIGGGDGGGKAAGRREGKLQRMPRTQHRNQHVTEAASPGIGAAWAPNTPNADHVRPETGAGCGKGARPDLCGGRGQSSSLPRPLHQEGHRARARPVERPTTGYVAPVPPRTVSDMIANSFRSHHITPPTTITLVFSMGQSARFLNDSRPTPVVHSSETLMRKKHPKTTTAERLEHLLRAFALQRLQRGSPPTAKPKAKRSKKR